MEPIQDLEFKMVEISQKVNFFPQIPEKGFPQISRIYAEVPPGLKNELQYLNEICSAARRGGKPHARI